MLDICVALSISHVSELLKKLSALNRAESMLMLCSNCIAHLHNYTRYDDFVMLRSLIGWQLM